MADYFVRRRNDVSVTGDASVRTVTYERSEAENVIAIDAFDFIFNYIRTEADACIATDVGFRVATYERAESEQLTATEGTTKNASYAKSEAETQTVTDTFDFVYNYIRTEAEPGTATDGGFRTVTYERSEGETSTTLDAPIEYDDYERAEAETVTVADAGFRVVTYERSEAETLTTVDDIADIEQVIKPRYVYIRHINGKPATVIQWRDWGSGQAGSNTLGGVKQTVPFLRGGLELKMLAPVLGSWDPSGKGHLSVLMQKGLAILHEDYLMSTTRQLTSWQASYYTSHDAPWITWVLFRTKTGIVDDAIPYYGSVSGCTALDWNKLRVKLVVTGGAAVTAEATPWYRDVYPTYRGPWVEGETQTNASHLVEWEIENKYREVYIQLTNISGIPTSTAIYLSGC